ncbi:hypothetical protein [Bacillus smithii]|uniref:hypothetical protein n=1 Tax=Bacillus smithii TaxID=1479 RepID=UPI002E2405EB|nr:hypothetical protein [Bacillus smithii]
MENNKAVPVNVGTACNIKIDNPIKSFQADQLKFQNPQQLKKSFLSVQTKDWDHPYTLHILSF